MLRKVSHYPNIVHAFIPSRGRIMTKQGLLLVAALPWITNVGAWGGGDLDTFFWNRLGWRGG